TFHETCCLRVALPCDGCRSNPCGPYRDCSGNTQEITMRYLHTMVRVTDIERSLDFYCNKLGLKEVRRHESEQGRYTLIFLAAPGDEQAGIASHAPLIELTWNWDPEDYAGGRNFGHLAYEVDDIYATCRHLM